MPFYTEYALFTGDDSRLNAVRAAEKLKKDFAGRHLVGLVYYAAANYDPHTLVEEPGSVLEEERRELGGISAILGAGCMLGQAQLKNENRVPEYEKLFAAIPTLDFSSHGEICISVVSQSASMVVFA